MLCQHCSKNTATTHVKSTVNGETTEYMLCADCAKELGYGNIFSDFHADFNSLLGSFFSGALPARTSATRCPSCKSSFNEIVDSGKVGCAECYDVFYNELMPTIRNVHGNTEHVGKRPNPFKKAKNEKNPPKQETEQDKLSRLKAELNAAVEKQDFERAATLRDEIKTMEAES